MTKQRRALAALGVAGLMVAAGCGKKDDGSGGGDGQVKETGQEVSKNPFAAVKQLADAAQKTAEDMQKMQEMKPVEPVKFDVLIPFLPAPEGWKAEEAKGSTSAMGEWKITVVSNRYQRGGGEADPPPPLQSVEVEITDGGFAPMVYAPFKMMSQFSNESTEGYQKGVTVDGGHPGFETWQKASKSSELTVLLANRFLVQLKGDQVEAATLREWLGTMKLGELASLK